MDTQSRTRHWKITFQHGAKNTWAPDELESYCAALSGEVASFEPYYSAE